MSLKRSLLITCTVIATTVTVRSQSAPPAAAPPRALLGQAGGAAVPATVQTAVQRGPVVPLSLDPPPSGDGAEASRADEIDLSALRYFASQNDLGRVAAETKLIRMSHPDWEPPEDLFTDGRPSVDEQPLWDLFARHDLAGIHAKMDEMRQGAPDWRPSNNLAGKLALAEAHDTLVQASDEKRWKDVIRAAAGNKMLLTCGDIDALWRTAEALARTDDEARATEAYRYILNTCSSPGERLSTVQKAGLVLKSPDAVDRLLKMGRRSDGGHDEFEPVLLDQIRRKVGEAAADPTKSVPTQAEVDRLSAAANTPAGANDAQLLGWYFYASGDQAQAQRWFRAALGLEKTGKAAEGLVLSLRSAGNGADARSAAVDYAGLGPLNRKLMIEVMSTALATPGAPALRPDESAVMAAAVDEARSQDGAQTLGIYYSSRKDASAAKAWMAKYNDWREEELEKTQIFSEAAYQGWQYYKKGDMQKAELWFLNSLKWEVNESAAVGLTLVARKLQHEKKFSNDLLSYRGRYPAVAKLDAAIHQPSRPVRVQAIAAAHIERFVKEPAPHRTIARVRTAPRQSVASNDGRWDQSATDIVSTVSAGNYEAALTMLDKRKSSRPEPRGLTVVRGWAMYHRGDWDGAKQIFTNLDGGAYSQERMEGLRVIDYSYTPPHAR